MDKEDKEKEQRLEDIEYELWKRNAIKWGQEIGVNVQVSK